MRVKMREIKFRIFDKHKKYMHKVDSLFLDEKMFRVIDYKNEHDVFSYDTEYFSEPMQYTGLKDKNGKEIYEGDIVKKRNGNYKLGKVAFDFGMFCFKSIGCGIYANSDIFEAIHSLHYVEFDEINNYEVIGNIYENPELLKEK